jgi:SPP1 gp7 family putative phage head morphogenesis protein
MSNTVILHNYNSDITIHNQHISNLKDLEIEKYQVLATLDMETCSKCADMDLKVFDIKDYKEGVTAPPFHPWCRCTTIPYFDDNLEFGERAARNTDGKTYYVPKNISYKEWRKTLDKKS